MGDKFAVNGVNGAKHITLEATAKVTEDLTGAEATTYRVEGNQTFHELKQAERMGENVSISDEQLLKAIDRAIKSMQGHSTSLDFSVHEATKQILVKVVDKDSGKILREIPPEKNLDFLAKLWEMAGILVDERR